MKKFVRTPWVQSALAWLIAAYLNVALATTRWRFENREGADRLIASPQGGVMLFWHGSIILAVACREMLKAKPRRVLISSSPDGELIAKIVSRLSLPAIRGSTTMDRRANRRSVGAFREAMKFIEDGGLVAITPDGPRGPAERMPPGPLMLARAVGGPVFVFGLAARPVIRLRSWDRTQIPLPFARGYVVCDGPLSVERKAGPDVVEATRQDWQARLRAAQARAESLLAA